MTATGCDNSTVIVSIPPLRSLVTAIIGGDFQVETLLPAGASPETYEPTPQQLIATEHAPLIFVTGLLDFEKVIVGKLCDKDGNKVVILSKGIQLIEGHGVDADGHNTGTPGRGHGVDPHIWLSPIELAAMAGNIYNAIARLHPDSAKYAGNYHKLISDLSALNERIKNEIDSAKIKSILIYHPALTYYASHYGLAQIAIEQEGKEPSAATLKVLVDRAKKEKIDKIFYEKQFPEAVVRSISQETGARAVEIDPLREDVMRNLLDITTLIIKK